MCQDNFISETKLIYGGRENSHLWSAHQWWAQWVWFCMQNKSSEPIQNLWKQKPRHLKEIFQAISLCKTGVEIMCVLAINGGYQNQLGLYQMYKPLNL